MAPNAHATDDEVQGFGGKVGAVLLGPPGTGKGTQVGGKNNACCSFRFVLEGYWTVYLDLYDS